MGDKALERAKDWFLIAKSFLGARYSNLKEWLFEEEEFETVIDDASSHHSNEWKWGKSMGDILDKRTMTNGKSAEDIIFGEDLHQSAA